MDNNLGAVFGTGETLNTGALLRKNRKLRSWVGKYDKTDIGVELGLLDNRLTAELDYFRKDTRDILINLPIPDISATASDRQ